MKKSFRPIIAARNLSEVDETMARLIEIVGRCRLQVNDTYSPFQTLLRSIIYQKIAGHSASAIYARVQGLFDEPDNVLPEALLELPPDLLLDAGLSRAKRDAVIDLADKVLAGVVPSFEETKSLSNEEIIERVTEVRGIGRWTVEMMLIYRLGREDVLPVGDFAIRKGYQLAYRKKESPTPVRLTAIGERWAPHRSVASWYLWRATDSVDWSV